MEDQLMSCSSCGSRNVIELSTETCLHFPGQNGLNVEPIFIFPKAVACLDCGSMQSSLARREVEQVSKAVIRFNLALG